MVTTNKKKECARLATDKTHSSERKRKWKKKRKSRILLLFTKKNNFGRLVTRVNIILFNAFISRTKGKKRISRKQNTSRWHFTWMVFLILCCSLRCFLFSLHTKNQHSPISYFSISFSKLQWEKKCCIRFELRFQWRANCSFCRSVLEYEHTAILNEEAPSVRVF